MNDELFLSKLKNLVTAAQELNEVWEDPNFGTEDYPTSIGSFDEFLIKLRKWELAQRTIINQLSIFQGVE